MVPVALFWWGLGLMERLNRTAWLHPGREMNLALYFMITTLNSDMNRLCPAFYIFHSTLL